MWDDLFNLIYSWGHRYWVEIGLTFVVFLVIHFVGYPFLIRRHDATAKTSPAVLPGALPTIRTGDITTHGADSGVYVGTQPPPNTPKPNEGHK
jgi:hypothetical protein